MERHKYELKMIHHDGTELVLKGNKELLSEVMEDIITWLRGSGWQDVSIDKYFTGE